MRLFITLMLYTFLLENSNSREYHYDKPATPFYTGPTNYAQTPANYFPPSQGVVPQQPPPASHSNANLPAVVRTYGPTARDYIVSGVTNSHQIFEGKQLPPVPATHVVPPPPANYHQQQQHSAHQPRANSQFKYHTIAPQGVYLPPPPPPGYQEPKKPAHNRPPHGSYSAQTNPFNQVTYPQGTAGSNYAQAGGSSYAQAGGTYNGAAGQGVHNGQYGNSAQQIAANYGPPSQQFGGAGNAGHYVSQSEAGQLDVYQHKQIGGDPRPFKRIISTCYPNGQCVPVTLEGGGAPTQNADARHQHFVVAARARTVPASDKCQRIKEAKRLANANAVYAAPPVGTAPAGQSARQNYATAAGYLAPNQNNYASPAGNYAAPQNPNYAAPPNGNYANPQNGIVGGNFGSSLTSPGTNTGFTGATNTIDNTYNAPAAAPAPAEPQGPVRPTDRRLFEYSEVVLNQYPFN